MLLPLQSGFLPTATKEFPHSLLQPSLPTYVSQNVYPQCYLLEADQLLSHRIVECIGDFNIKLITRFLPRTFQMFFSNLVWELLDPVMMKLFSAADIYWPK